MSPLIRDCKVRMGCDPEIFITTKGGKVVSAKQVVPKSMSRVTDDGVQVEINPQPSGCRETLRSNIHNCLVNLENLLKVNGYRLTSSSVIELSSDVFDTLGDEEKDLGCEPSRCVEGSNKTVLTAIDKDTFKTRSAGGHLHFSDLDYYYSCHRRPFQPVFDKNLIQTMDSIVGNTCVLLDHGQEGRDRRKYYGQAGEYRLRRYAYDRRGFEYRTLSNFWLRAPTLMSLVFTLSRWAIGVHLAKYYQRTPEARQWSVEAQRELLSLVPRKDIVTAINNNDPDLALINFERIMGFLAPISNNYQTPIHDKQDISVFKWFAEQGIDRWFKDDIFSEWRTDADYHYNGWESFRDDVLRPGYVAAK